MPARPRNNTSMHRVAELAERARAMRAAPTLSEARLWEELRGSRLGVGFRRQGVVGDYIADFVAPSIRLIVEVDGGYHAERERADARRDERLRRAGYRVLRVSAEAVLARTAAVVEVIRGAVASG